MARRPAKKFGWSYTFPDSRPAMPCRCTSSRQSLLGRVLAPEQIPILILMWIHQVFARSPPMTGKPVKTSVFWTVSARGGCVLAPKAPARRPRPATGTRAPTAHVKKSLIQTNAVCRAAERRRVSPAPCVTMAPLLVKTMAIVGAVSPLRRSTATTAQFAPLTSAIPSRVANTIRWFVKTTALV